MDPDILSAAKVADLLQLDLGVVLRLFEDRHLPGRQIGPQWYTTRRQLMEYIEGGTPPPAQAPPAPAPQPAPRAQVHVQRPVRMPNSWNCGRCGILNDVERVECKVCGEPRDMPLLGYIPRG